MTSDRSGWRRRALGANEEPRRYQKGVITSDLSGWHQRALRANDKRRARRRGTPGANAADAASARWFTTQRR